MGDQYAISTSSLVAYYGILQQIGSKCSLYLQENKDEQTVEYERQIVKLEKVKKEIGAIKVELDKRKNHLKISEEELYLIGGYKDAYLMINFFPGSDAYEKYGESVHGTIWYHKRERERLDDITSKPGYGRSDGIVYLQSGTDNALIKEALLKEGFAVRDIYEIYSTGTANVKTYRQPGQKEIPYTQTIKIDPKTFDLVSTQQYVLGAYLKDGYTLPPHDLTLYYANLFVFKRDKIAEEEIRNYLMKPDQSGFSDLADYIIHDIKAREKITSEGELEHFKQLLRQRRDNRIHFIKQHLGISENQLTQLRDSDFERYITLETSAWMFETETLEFLSQKAVIFWDYERFMHTFLRHNPDFFVAASTKGQGTSFQYSQKDITRVAKIIITQLKNEIVDKLNDNKEFAKIGHYYNGNHYQIRIAPDGRLMQFHPMD